jgi:outer membrane receptor for ferrienterochelin and colicins
VRQLYFPVFDAPGTNNGVAQGLDGGHLGQFYGHLNFKNLVFTGAYGTRQKDVPTASFGSEFNEQQFREQTTDRHLLADVEYSRTLGVSHLTVRGSFDRFSYDGSYPVPGATAGATQVGLNSVLGTSWTGEATLTRPLPGRQLLTVGAELVDNVHQNQQLHYVNPTVPVFDIARSSLQKALYLQDEVKLTRWLIANGGLRYDRYELFQPLSPRAALIVIPSPNQSFKYLYGRAFRAPNEYELNSFYFGDSVQDLHPESIDTQEVVWERYTNDWLRTSVSAYRYTADGLITLISDPSALLGATYVNEEHVQGKGLELEAQMRLGAGLQGLMSYALQRAEDVVTGAALVNSPGQMAKLRLSVPGPSKRSFVSVEVLSMSSRRTLAGATLTPATTANVTVIVPVGRGLELAGIAQNLFNVQYADPASASLQQDSIVQNGRTWRVGLSWKFLSK